MLARSDLPSAPWRFPTFLIQLGPLAPVCRRWVKPPGATCPAFRSAGSPSARNSADAFWFRQKSISGKRGTGSLLSGFERACAVLAVPPLIFCTSPRTDHRPCTHVGFVLQRSFQHYSDNRPYRVRMRETYPGCTQSSLITRSWNPIALDRNNRCMKCVVLVQPCRVAAFFGLSYLNHIWLPNCLLGPARLFPDVVCQESASRP